MPKKTNKKRGGLLTAWLIIMLAGNFISSLFWLLFFSPIISGVYPNIPFWAPVLYEIFGLINILLVIFLFMWKKWAFYSFCGISLVLFFLNIYFIGFGINVILGLVGPVVLYLIMRPKWNLFG